MSESIPGAAPGNTTDSMRREISELQKQIRDLKSLQNSGRLWVLATLVITVVMFAIFSFGTYARIKGNFNEKAVQQAMSQHGSDVIPLAQRMLIETGQNAMPAYRDAVVATMRDRGPAAASDAVAKFKGVAEDSGKEFQEKMNKTFDAAITKIEPDFKAAYPNIPDDKRQDLIKAFAADQIDAQNKQLAGQVNHLYTNDLIRTQAVLDKFEVPETDSTGGRDAMEKKFLKTMIALLDQQVDDAYADPTAAGATTRTAMK